MQQRFIVLISILLGFSSIQAQLLTTAEKSDYASTSTFEDVMNFTQTLLDQYDLIRMETLATSVEGRNIPLFIVADPMPASPEDLKDDDRIVVYFQANIHAGEVEGKEATQMLMRDLLKDHPRDIFRNVVLLVCPIFNADGNEKISPKNRTNQNGPVNGVGLRHNGQYLDLNRDAMKLESPEMRGVVENIFNRWDPAITVDCHTTNGSYHEEPVTFVWMMNPNGDRNLINFARDEMMPAVHENLLKDYNVENVFYGEFINRMNPDSGWISYAPEPRYMVNYIGLRNRIGILNENYVYADFKTRVNGCYYLLKTILDYSASKKQLIKQTISSAERRLDNRYKLGRPDVFALEYEGVATPEKITIKAIEADTIPGVKGYWRYKQSDRKRTVTVDYIADYYATETTTIPFAYLLTVPEPMVLENLKSHGIQVEKLDQQMNLPVERFEISDLKASERLFQGHYQNKVEGSYVADTVSFDAGTYVVYTSQNLGNLAAYLFEPQSDDGYLKWNFLDRYLVPQWGRYYYPYPVYRLMNVTPVPSSPISKD
ncbi:MAG: hypothetical protein KDC05_05315 [Bacteroidales bacterium]|nr:hypothetical protein [Bacteroidales bacterium]